MTSLFMLAFECPSAVPSRGCSQTSSMTDTHVSQHQEAAATAKEAEEKVKREAEEAAEKASEKISDAFSAIFDKFPFLQVACCDFSTVSRTLPGAPSAKVKECVSLRLCAVMNRNWVDTSLELCHHVVYFSVCADRG